MPIANCLVSSNCKSGNANLIDLWAKESGLSSKDMTITITRYDLQVGNKYDAIVNLYLPSMWSINNISKLQMGLSKAVAEYFTLTIEKVIVITSVIEAGNVVEAGEIVKW